MARSTASRTSSSVSLQSAPSSSSSTHSSSVSVSTIVAALPVRTCASVHASSRAPDPYRTSRGRRARRRAHERRRRRDDLAARHQYGGGQRDDEGLGHRDRVRRLRLHRDLDRVRPPRRPRERRQVAGVGGGEQRRHDRVPPVRLVDLGRLRFDRAEDEPRRRRVDARGAAVAGDPRVVDQAEAEDEQLVRRPAAFGVSATPPNSRVCRPTATASRRTTRRWSSCSSPARRRGR